MSKIRETGKTCGSVDHTIHRRQFLEGTLASALSDLEAGIAGLCEYIKER